MIPGLKTFIRHKFMEYRHSESPRWAMMIACLVLAAAPGQSQAQLLSAEFRAQDTPLNKLSEAGVPISRVAGAPAGSNGLQPTPEVQGNEGLTLNPATNNQFQGFHSFGGIIQTRIATTATRNYPSYEAFAEAVLPSISDGINSRIYLTESRIGGLLGSRRYELFFGSIIQPPSEDENGDPLGFNSSEHWSPEPLWPAGSIINGEHVGAPYYWSQHARNVFANSIGQVTITWRRLLPIEQANPEDFTDSSTHVVINNRVYPITTTTQLVSGTPVISPRRVYWTENSFRNSGIPIQVPDGITTNFVYNERFPKTVTSQFTDPGASDLVPPGEGTVLQELRTVFYDSSTNSVRAFNFEGRIFLELLGDSLGGTRRQHLGFEIVDVVRRVNPVEISIELGEKVTAWQGGQPSDSSLLPRPLTSMLTSPYAFLHARTGERNDYYAVRETTGINDYLLHWMENGKQSIQWPARFVRYKFVWPKDIVKYSHYIRPQVDSELQAAETAIQLPTLNSPYLEYQDPLDRPRAKLTQSLSFYTYLTPEFPIHRSLLRYQDGDNISFDRVLSWLDSSLALDSAGQLTASANLASALGDGTQGSEKLIDQWNPATGTFELESPFHAPRVIHAVADVGQRINPPDDELASMTNNQAWAGHIRPDKGTSFHPKAYVDPIINGFSAANRGAIIPVNAIPGENRLEVWWFRASRTLSNQGFQPTYWPSVIARYTLRYPLNPREIVLASNDGTGPLQSLEALATVYAQNDRSKPGYNPNEEHALMIGGQGYALRDDLNDTRSRETYTSEPFVLLEHTAADGRPAIATFKVLRDKPEAGLVFDYVVEAGTILQAPMPLPLLNPPTEGEGVAKRNFNNESGPAANDGDLPGGWNPSFHANGPFSHYNRFTWLDRKDSFWVYRGFHSGEPALEAGTYDRNAGIFEPPAPATAIAGQSFKYTFHTSQRAEALLLTLAENASLPERFIINGLSIEGAPSLSMPASTQAVELVLSSRTTGETIPLTLELSIGADGTVVSQGPLRVSSTNPLTNTSAELVGRPPYLANDPVPSNSFLMRFYYKNLAGFDWPGITNPPAIGTIVPYLRPLTNPDGGGDPINGFAGNPSAKEADSLDIIYRPVWPAATPVINLGDTLTNPKNGLPAVRGQSSIQILYQQSLAADLVSSNDSVVLIDPTREKESNLALVPPAIRTENLLGRVFFPNLPSHLAERLFWDPNRGSSGRLVLQGKFMNSEFGSDYLLLNVLRGDDLAAVKDLHPLSPPEDKAIWDAAVNALTSNLDTFVQNPNVPGTYIPDPALTQAIGVGEIAEIESQDIAVDSYALGVPGPGHGYVTLVSGGGSAFTPAGEPVSLHVIRVVPVQEPGELKVLFAANPLNESVTFQHSPDLGGRHAEYEYDWRIAAPNNGLPPAFDDSMSQWLAADFGTGKFIYTLGGANIRTLADNYLIVRYRPIASAHPLYTAAAGETVPDDAWSEWSSPMLAEGWIKRVLGGINPFNQRVGNLFSNDVNTEVSMLTQAGKRWEGAVALNLENIDDFGLIEIYETVLRRGRMLSIESGVNYGPANDALLLAAGYLNDLYRFVADEAWADALNPTIGISTADNNFGDIATSMFSFMGQMPNLLEEELALVRGRNDFLLPGVATAPVYNRLVWNYTRGINSGEVVYALNYDIRENPNSSSANGVLDAADAARLYPQGHGDAYGHYLTALKGYQSLIFNDNFTWVPRIESVLVLGQPVSVDYVDERKFVGAAAAVARTGSRAFDLTWRRDYQSGRASGWSKFAETRVNGSTGRERHWSMDHWATRTGIGAYVNWVVGNAIVPAVDQNPSNEGIQKIDRTTVLELLELPTIMEDLQTNLSNAEAGLTPLGLPEGSVAFDISPNEVAAGKTHFEQISDRAVIALNNAVSAFDDSKDISRLMRAESSSLENLQERIDKEEFAYNNALIETFGTPYPDDIGPGKTYSTDYSGPDLIHFMYVDRPALGGKAFDGYPMGDDPATWRVNLQMLPADWQSKMYMDASFYQMVAHPTTGEFQSLQSSPPIENPNFVDFTLGPHGFNGKPASWTSVRNSPGEIQQSISELLIMHFTLANTLDGSRKALREMSKNFELFEAFLQTDDAINNINRGLIADNERNQWMGFAYDTITGYLDAVDAATKDATDAAVAMFPESVVLGLANGGDLTSAARGAVKTAATGISFGMNKSRFALDTTKTALLLAAELRETRKVFEEIDVVLAGDEVVRNLVVELGNQLTAYEDFHENINRQLLEFEATERKYRATLARGYRLLEEREIFRKRSAAAIQGFRTRDAAFRNFRNEKLERYNTLFDLAARYTFLAAQAYDYETGLLGTNAGRSFVERIVSSRALGVVSGGKPQFAGSNAGDPGLSSTMAEMLADWSVLKGRLGFNNPDGYGTTVSLRGEKFRIRPGTGGETDWRDVLNNHYIPNILEDPDIRRHAMQVENEGLAVPGIVIPFSTTIATGRNLFGNPLMGGDSNFSPTSFATKIHSVGVALEGYVGMTDPSTNDSVVGQSGGTSPSEPLAPWLNPDALAATPYIYLIPCGLDSMRSPPLGDTSTIRSWNVRDVTIPLPFNVGASQFSTLQWWQSSDFLSGDLFSIRKHQAFRPVSSTSYFGQDIYGGNGNLANSQFTNSRLIGRSVWNSQWKLVIPGNTLYFDSEEGIKRLIRNLNDIKLHFVTYSYSGN